MASTERGGRPVEGGAGRQHTATASTAATSKHGHRRSRNRALQTKTEAIDNAQQASGSRPRQRRIGTQTHLQADEGGAVLGERVALLHGRQGLAVNAQTGHDEVSACCKESMGCGEANERTSAVQATHGQWRAGRHVRNKAQLDRGAQNDAEEEHRGTHALPTSLAITVAHSEAEAAQTQE